VRVVTLNVQFGRRVPEACRLFARAPELAPADVVLLQEMDLAGTERIASALGMRHVYHAACVHVRTGRDFGNAILSRWPLGGDEKIELPHRSLRDRSARAATVATVATPVGPVVVASVHLATRVEQTPRARRRQLASLLHRLRAADRAVVGGDFNGHRIARLALADGFEWTTRELGGWSAPFTAIDHIVTRGLHARQVGRVTDTRDATDHPAVWADLVPAGEPGSAR